MIIQDVTTALAALGSTTTLRKVAHTMRRLGFYSSCTFDDYENSTFIDRLTVQTEDANISILIHSATHPETGELEYGCCFMCYNKEGRFIRILQLYEVRF